MGQQQRPLAEVVERQRRQHERKPRQAHRPGAEVPHVGVQRLGTRQRQHHRPQRDKREPAVSHRKLQSGDRVQRRENRRRLHQMNDAGAAQHDEPDHHHRPEHHADARRAVLLQHEQTYQHHQCDLHDIRRQRGHGQLQALDRRQHRDGRRDHTVAIKQCGAEHANHQQRVTQLRLVGHRRGSQREQRHDAALAVVVGTHDEGHVFQGHHDHQGPEDERHDADQVRLIQGQPVGRIEDGLHHVQRAGADVAVDNAQGAQSQGGMAGRAGFARHKTGLRRTAGIGREAGDFAPGVVTSGQAVAANVAAQQPPPIQGCRGAEPAYS